MNAILTPADASAIQGQRDDQRKAMIWLIISYVNLAIFVVGLMIPATWDVLDKHPLFILPPGGMALGALFWIAFGYSLAYNKAEENIRLIAQNRNNRRLAHLREFPV